MAGPTRVGSPASASSASASVQSTYPQTPTAGNYLVMSVLVTVLNSTNQPTITTPTGYTLLVQGGSNSVNAIQVGLFYKVATSSESAPTVTSGATGAVTTSVVVDEFSGCAGIDVISTVSSQVSTNSVSNSLTTSGANDLIVSAFGQYTGNTSTPSITWTGGNASDATNTGQPSTVLATGTQVVPSSGSVSPGCSNSAAAATGSPCSMVSVAVTAYVPPSTYNHTIPAQYTTATQVSAPNLYALSASAAGTSATAVSFGALEAVNLYYGVCTPNTTNSTVSTTAPASSVAWDSIGWQMDQPIVGNTTDTGTIQAGSETATVSLTSSATLAVTVTIKYYVGGVQVGTGTSASTSIGTSATAVSVPISYSALSIPANGRLQIKMWLAATNTAISATTVTVNFGTATVLPAFIRFNIQASRSTSDLATATDSTKRGFTGSRKTTDAASVSDSSIRAVMFPRASSDASTGADSTVRVFSAVRTTADSSTATDSAIRSFTGSRTTADSTAGTDSTARALTYGRFTADGPGDVPLRYATKSITGTTRDQNGNVLGGCTVRLFRERDGVVVATTTSDSTTGVYTFPRDVSDQNSYTIMDVKPGSSPSLQGISPSGNVPS